MAIPSAVPPHSDFGEPLPAKHEIAIPAGSLQDFGELVVKPDLELHLTIWRNRPGQVYLHHRAIILVVVVGMSELQLRGQIALAHHFEALDLVRSIVLR